MPAPDVSNTQAAGLQSRPVQVIAVASGKGGVGKSSVSINLAMALQMAGEQVMLLDADFALANVDVLLGLQPHYHLGHVLAGECELADTVLTGPHGLLVVPASSGNSHLAEMSIQEHAGLIHAFSTLPHAVDYLVVDTAAGIAGNVVTFAQAAQHVLVVVCDEPASITDAYALIKVMSREHHLNRFQVVANMTRSPREGQQLFEKLLRVTDRFLDVHLGFAGAIPFDEKLRKAIQHQRAVVDAWPGAPSGRAFSELAGRVRHWQRPAGSSGHLEFYMERLVGAPKGAPV